MLDSSQCQPYRLIAFDVDGTLISSKDGRVVWQILNRYFGEGDGVNARRFKAYLNGEITYAEWVALDVGQWVKAGATRDQMAAVIQEHLFLVPGARLALAGLQQKGYLLAVISGTLDLTLELLLPEHPFLEVYTNKIWFGPGGEIAGWEATPFDMEGKARALVDIAQRHQVPLSQTVFVGDNINDLQVMQAAGLAIAFEPKHAQVAEQADFVVAQDLRELLRVL